MTTPRTIRRGEPGYPERLATIADPPPAIRVLGELQAPRARVAIVGSRLADAYGREMARSIGRDLARAGVSVVSGGAEGIDAAAHEGALEAGGHTVAVFGCGISVTFPASHRELFERIVSAGGALVSEYEDEQRPTRWTFPRRNRIVSGMSDAVVVVRAGTGSGALITADFAREQGVPVLAVPAQVGDPLAAGPLGLLRTGARIAAGAEDVLDEIGLGAQLALPIEVASPQLAGPEAAAYAALGRDPRHADEVARRAGLGAGAALAALLQLELGGLCEQRPGHYFLRRN